MSTNPNPWKLDAHWLVLNPKIKAALAVLLAGNTAGIIAALNGTLPWNVELGVIVGSVLTTLAGYLTPASGALSKLRRKPTP